MTIQIQTTSQCNGQCIFCPYQTSWFKENPGKMSDLLYTKIIQDLAEHKPLFSEKFCPYLCNEPFLDPKLLDRVEEAIETLHNPFIEISTNFTTITPKQIDRLVSLYKRIGWNGRVMISHHGITPTQYKTVMGLKWGKALGNLKHLIEVAGGNLPIWIHTATASFDGTFHINRVDAIAKFWAEWFRENDLPFANVTVYPLIFHNRAGNVKYKGWNPPSTLDYTDCPRVYDLHVLWNGEVACCCCDYAHEQIIGNLSKQSVQQYFDSPKYAKWVKQVKGEEEVPDDFICKRCTRIGA